MFSSKSFLDMKSRHNDLMAAFKVTLDLKFLKDSPLSSFGEISCVALTRVQGKNLRLDPRAANALQPHNAKKKKKTGNTILDLPFSSTFLTTTQKLNGNIRNSSNERSWIARCDLVFEMP